MHFVFVFFRWFGCYQESRFLNSETDLAWFWTLCCSGPSHSHHGKEGVAVLSERLFRKKHGGGTISECKRSMRRRWREWWVLSPFLQYYFIIIIICINCTLRSSNSRCEDLLCCISFLFLFLFFSGGRITIFCEEKISFTGS